MDATNSSTLEKASADELVRVHARILIKLYFSYCMGLLEVRIIELPM